MSPSLLAASAPDLNGGLESLDYVVIAAYLAAMLTMGTVIAYRQRSTEDFFVGGRSLPAWAVGLSLIASLLSTITYLGFPGEMFRTGLTFLARQAAIPFTLVVVWFVWIPFFMKLNLTSAYEYLERRFNYPTRALAGFFCLCLLFGWIAVVVLTASDAMVEIVQLNLDWFFGVNGDVWRDADIHAIILAVGLFSVLYTTLGGIRAVIWTDVIQFLILVAGALFTIGYIAATTGSGPADWIAAQRAYPHRESVEWFSFDPEVRSTVVTIALGAFAWHACTHGSNQIALQRYFSTKDASAARTSFLVNALSSFGLGLVLSAVGIALIYFIQQHPLPAYENLYTTDADVRHLAQKSIFPQFIRIYLPAGLRGLVVAALFAAAMSTIDSGSNSASTILTIDFFRPAFSDRLTPRKELILARTLTASMGLVVVVATIGLYHLSKGTNIIDLCQKGFNCFLGPLGGLFTLAMFSRRATPATVIPAVLGGEAFGIASSYSKELFGIQFSTHLVVAGAWLTTIITSHILSALLKTEATLEQRQWLRKAVLEK